MTETETGNISVPHPMTTTQLVGHKEAWAAIHGWCHSAKTPGVLLLEGPRGCGKASLVYQLIQSMLDDTHAGYIRADMHPDMMRIEVAEGKQHSGVDDVRSAMMMARKSPMMGTQRWLVVDAIDEVTPQGINSLLKCIEEPPCWVFLIAHQPALVPATIRSRCFQYRLKPVSTHEAIEVFRARGGKHDEADAYIALSEHSPGIALSMAHQNILACYVEMLRFINIENPIDFHAFYKWMSHYDTAHHQGLLHYIPALLHRLCLLAIHHHTNSAITMPMIPEERRWVPAQGASLSRLIQIDAALQSLHISYDKGDFRSSMMTIMHCFQLA